MEAGEHEDGELRALDRLIGSILNALKGRGTECSWERRCYYDALAAFGRMPRLAQLLQGKREAEEKIEALRRKVGELHEWGNQGWAQLASANAELETMKAERNEARRMWDHYQDQARIVGQKLEDAVAQQGAANARVEELEGLLRAWMATSDLAKDITFVPIYKRTKAALPEARETPDDAGFLL